jgi:hypothetical protein
MDPEDSLPCSQERATGLYQSQMNPVDTLQSNFFNINLIISPPPT